MGFQYLTNTPLDEACAAYLARLRENGLAPEPERVCVQDAAGRVSYKAVYARICAPHYHACAMDGAAVAAASTFGATETTPVELPEGACVPVDTGDPLPPGCDAVIMAEEIEPLPGGGIRLRRDRGWAWICPDEKRPLCRMVSESTDAEVAGELCDFCEKALREHMQP